MRTFFSNGYEYDADFLTRLTVYESVYQKWHNKNTTLVINGKETILENDIFAIIDKYGTSENKQRATKYASSMQRAIFACTLEAVLEYIDTIEEFNDCIKTFSDVDLNVIETEAKRIRTQDDFDVESFSYLDPTVCL